MLDPYDRIAVDTLVWDAGIFGSANIGDFRAVVVQPYTAASESPADGEPSDGELLHSAYLLGLAMGLRIAAGVR